MQREVLDLEEATYFEMFRSMPVQSGLFTVGPVILAIAQLANTTFNGLALSYGVAFAVVMVSFSVMITRYHLVEFRLHKFQRALEH